MTEAASGTPRVGTLADDQMLTGPLARRRELFVRAREAGLDHVFVADHVSFFTGFGMDGLVQAATIAALEPVLEIHIGVYLLALRHPVPVARQIATLCESAPGRLVTLLALSLAGGLTTFGDEDDILILRREGGQQRAFAFDYSAVKRGEELESNIVLRSGDVVVVSD